MTDKEIYTYWGPHKAFYVASMMFRTQSALDSVEVINWIVGKLNGQEDKLPENWRSQLLDQLQNIVVQGAALSRFFWPAQEGERKIHKTRGKLLREEFSINETSPLKDRLLRNKIEHFDENLDKYLQQGIVGYIFPDFIGHSNEGSEVPVHIFRGYFLDNGVFQILGAKFETHPLVAEINRIHSLLKKLHDNGS